MEPIKEDKPAAGGEEARGDGTKAIAPGPEVEEFAVALDSCLGPGLSLVEKKARVLDLPRKFHENAIRRMLQKQPTRVRDGHENVDMDADEPETAQTDTKALDEIKQLEREVQTWDLVRRLLPLRFSEPRPQPSLFTTATAKPTQANTLHELIDTDPVLKERRAVLQWLQINTASGPDIDELARELQQNADRGDIIAHGWLHTRSKIKLRKSMTAWPHLLDRQSPNVAASHVNSDGAPLVTHLDPDAVTRQGRRLEPQDDFFERAIWLGCFQHFRRGSSPQTIREWCQERTEMWRAISMSALLLSTEGKESVADAPPRSLALWRRMCLSLARGGGSDDYERAVYGFLSGDIGSVEKVAKTWDDFMFANYNALLQSQMDSFLLGQCPPDVAASLTQSFPAFDAIQFHGNLDSVEKRLVTMLELQKSTMDEAFEPNKALQASLIADDLDCHLYEQALVMIEDANREEKSPILPRTLFGKDDLVRKKFFGLEQRHGLRIVAHVSVLVTLMRHLEAKEAKLASQLSSSHWIQGQESIIAAYTDYLARVNLQELIPLYCSILQPPRRYEVLGWNMIREKDAGKRMTQLKLINRVGIDVLKFVETLAKLVFEDLDHDGDKAVAKESFAIIGNGPPTVRHGRGIRPDFFGDDDAVIARKDEHVIRSLEWLLQVQVAWPEVLRIGVQAYKFFLRKTRLLAVRKLMERVTLDEIVQNLNVQEAPHVAMLDDIDFWTQQLEQSGITSAEPMGVMTDARNYRDLESLAKALDSLETMGSLMHLSLETEPGNRKFWSGVGDAAAVMKDKMQPLSSGWLLLNIESGDEELDNVRQVYLPETVLAFVSGLHFAGTGLSRDNLLECMDLAGVIAEHGSDLADAFVKAGRMTELVEAFAACSKALAMATSDKRAADLGSKKLREMGWSRDLWAIKQ